MHSISNFFNNVLTANCLTFVKRNRYIHKKKRRKDKVSILKITTFVDPCSNNTERMTELVRKDVSNFYI